ncbi:CD226 antigen isoform X1 [Protopterus annectens]|uniref:CD226 antigen isoform X1 n=1 Tax=Protopterus annectens TaxID=7888 RepID=UPI001CFADAF1|nr:CD226 antigen isoform X1 [Protopterus annectens]
MDCLITSILFLVIYQGVTGWLQVHSTVQLTKDVTLKCLYPYTDNISMVSWAKKISTGKDNVAVYSKQHGTKISDNYEGRAEFRNATAEATIIIRNVVAQDEGLYQCSVHAFPSGTWNKYFEIRRADVFRSNELADKVEEVEYNSNATLSCQYSLTDNVHHVTWEKFGKLTVDLIAICNFSGGKIYGADYEHRSQIDCTNRARSVLLITFIKTADEGFYRCHFRGSMGNQSTVIKMKVSEEDGNLTTEHMQKNMEIEKGTRAILKTEGTSENWRTFLTIYGGAAAGGLFLLLFAVIVIVYIRRKRQKQSNNKGKSGALHSNETQHMNSYGGTRYYKGAITSTSPSQIHEEEDIYINVPATFRQQK